MIRTFQIAASDRDFKAMMRGKGSPGRNFFFASLPVAIFLFLLVYYVIWRSLLAAGIVAAVILMASVWSNFRFFSDVARRKNSRADTEAVLVTEVQASSVLDIEPLGSNEPAWVFFAADGKAMLLVGQWLRDYRAFPSTSFRLYQWADTKEAIRIEATGKRIKPEHSTAQLRPSYRLTDVELFEATPETLQHDLDRAFDKKAG